MVITPHYDEKGGTTWLSLEAEGHIKLSTFVQTTQVIFFDITPTETLALGNALIEEYIKSKQKAEQEV